MSRLVEHVNITGRVSDLPHSGAPPVTSVCQDNFIRQRHLRDRFMTSKSTSNVVIGKHGRSIYRDTVINRLCEHRIHCSRPARCQGLTKLPIFVAFLFRVTLAITVKPSTLMFKRCQNCSHQKLSLSHFACLPHQVVLYTLRQTWVLHLTLTAELDKLAFQNFVLKKFVQIGHLSQQRVSMTRCKVKII
jgi:hypothetical protein